jgi:hypothetical protein
MTMVRVKGGWSLVDVSNNENFYSDQPPYWMHTLTHILKGTKIEPVTAQDDYDNGLAGAAGKSAKMLVRSANFDPDIYTDLKAAELAHTKLFFRFLNGIVLLLDDCEDCFNEYVSPYVTFEGNYKYNIGFGYSPYEKLITQSLGPLDLTSYKYIRIRWALECPCSAPFQILLDDTPECVSPLETLTFPDSIEGRRNDLLQLVAPANLSSIISIGIQLNGNTDFVDFWLFKIHAIQNAIILKNIIPTVETEVNEFGKFNALRIQGVGAADIESNLMELKI